MGSCALFRRPRSCREETTVSPRHPARAFRVTAYAKGCKRARRLVHVRGLAGLSTCASSVDCAFHIIFLYCSPGTARLSQLRLGRSSSGFQCASRTSCSWDESAWCCAWAWGPSPPRTRECACSASGRGDQSVLGARPRGKRAAQVGRSAVAHVYLSAVTCFGRVRCLRRGQRALLVSRSFNVRGVEQPSGIRGALQPSQSCLLFLPAPFCWTCAGCDCAMHRCICS